MSSKHSDSTLVHRLHRWSFANSTKRTAGIETVSLATTLDATTNTLTNLIQVSPNEIIYFSVLPASSGLSTATAYYVIAAATPNLFKVSLTLGGSAIDLTTSGAATINEISVTFTAADIGKRGYDVATLTYWDITNVVAGVPTWASANGEILPTGTTSQILQGDKTWIEKVSLPISTATQTELTTLNGKVVPAGGLTGQNLIKASATDNDTYWGSSTIQNTKLLWNSNSNLSSVATETIYTVQLTPTLLAVSSVRNNDATGTVRVRVVQYNTTGTVQNVGAEIVIFAGANLHHHLARISDTQFLVVYQSIGGSSQLTSVIVTISSITCTQGTHYEASVDTFGCYYPTVCRISATKFASTYTKDSNIYAIIINIAAGVITYGTPLQITTNAASVFPVIKTVSDTLLIISYGTSTGATEAKVSLLTINSSTLTLTSSITTGAASGQWSAIEVISASKYLLLFTSNTSVLKASILTLTGNTLTLGSIVDLKVTVQDFTIRSCIYNAVTYISFSSGDSRVHVGSISIENGIVLSTLLSLPGTTLKVANLVNLSTSLLIVLNAPETTKYLTSHTINIETTSVTYSNTKHLTIYDENGDVIVVNTENNALPIIDETGATLFADLVVTSQETVHTFTTYTANHTLVLTNASTISNSSPIVEMNVATANTLTIPPNSSVGFVIGSKIDVVQIGTGQTTITPGSGVTIYGTPGLKLRAQYSGVTLIKKAIDTWYALGDLSA